MNADVEKDRRAAIVEYAERAIAARFKKYDGSAWTYYRNATPPETVLALLAENQRLATDLALTKEVLLSTQSLLETVRGDLAATEADHDALQAECYEPGCAHCAFEGRLDFHSIANPCDQHDARWSSICESQCYLNRVVVQQDDPTAGGRS